MSSKKRLDEILLERQLASGLHRAEALIMSGRVLVDGQRTDKPGTRVDAGCDIRVRQLPRYVSRGGLKLEGALDALQLDVRGKTCLDLGASRGGFTDCLLQRGAGRVYAFDVGRGQLDWKLQTDSRVVRRDGMNVRDIGPGWVDETIDLIVIDLSFISLRLILPGLKAFPEADTLALVKPQFEARRREVAKGGLIPDEDVQREIVERVKGFARAEGFDVLAETPSPIRGQKGNQEYFLLLRLPHS